MAARRKSAVASPETDPRPARIPQQARSRRTREAILEAAVRCFEVQGYDETTTAMIASRARVGVGTVYQYFPDKRGILLELLDRNAKEVAGYVTQSLDPGRIGGADSEQVIRDLIDTIFQTQELRPGIQRILWERYFKDEDFRDLFRANHARLCEVVERSLVVLAAEGRSRDIDPERAAFVIVNAVQWNATQVFMDGNPELIEATAAATGDMVARYIFRD